MDDRGFKKLPVRDVYSFLRSERALIVHFSGTPPMPSGIHQPVYYPEDLRAVIRGDAMGGICCSVVRPGDCFDYYRDDRHACGSVGLIIGLQNEQSIIGVDPSDCGSSRNEQGLREMSHPRDITLEALQQTMTERDGWNEWVIRDYVVLGIFVGQPCMIWREDGAGNTGGVCTLAPEIQATFPEQRLLTFGHHDGIAQYAGTAERTSVAHAELYPA
jgi:hypothetical protein